MSEGLSGLSTEELRAAVRAVLRDVLPAAVLDTAHPSPQLAAGEQVVLRTDADLDLFVRRLAALCIDPGRRLALQEGRHAFRLSVAGRTGSATPASGEAGVIRIDGGAVTERTIAEAAAAGARLVLGKRAVLTPLARDKARSLGVAVTRQEET
jgi:hypothetical protein